MKCIDFIRHSFSAVALLILFSETGFAQTQQEVYCTYRSFKTGSHSRSRIEIQEQVTEEYRFVGYFDLTNTFDLRRLDRVWTQDCLPNLQYDYNLACQGTWDDLNYRKLPFRGASNEGGLISRDSWGNEAYIGNYYNKVLNANFPCDWGSSGR